MISSEKIRNPNSEIRNRVIFPVILAVPAEVADFKPRDRVSFLSQHARKALAASAQKSGISPGELKKDENGVPLPFDGTYWSITHKSEYVAGVVSSHPIGIDIEKILPCSRGLYKRTATEPEWSLAGRSHDDFTVFYRYWTAKEAALKASTTGIKDLLKCRIEQIVDEHHLVIDYLDKRWYIQHHFFNDHIAAVVENDARVVWTIV
jgi:4'-phosphopantetheinyl transferase